MFEDMGFINTYKIDLHTLARSDNSSIYTLNRRACVCPTVQLRGRTFTHFYHRPYIMSLCLSMIKRCVGTITELLLWCQVLSDGEERLQGPSVPQLDARLLRHSLLLPALQKPRAVQLPRVRICHTFLPCALCICITPKT